MLKAFNKLNSLKFLKLNREYSKASPEVIASIKSIFGTENFSVSDAIRSHHSQDESFHSQALPDAVVFPENIEQISTLMKICNNNNVPVIPYGVGSGFEGGINATSGGISVDMSKNMNKIVAVNNEDFDCVVEAGVTRIQLNTYLKDTGLWFPIDPGADATLGGMCATSASGTNAVRYGTMRENVLNLEVVLPDGSIVNTAGKLARSRKNVAGYNLTNLLVGSEGTLGVITKASLKLYPQPEMITSAVSPFPDAKSAVQAVLEIMQTGIPIARIEFLDENSIHGSNIYSKLNLEEVPHLFLEFHGSEKAVEQQAEIVSDICKQNSCKSFNWASDLEQRNKLWLARHHIWFALKSLNPNRKAISTDVCVPISKLPDILLRSQEEIKKYGLKTMVVGHVGDGNFHTFVTLDTENKQEVKNFEDYSKSLVKHALDLHGTSTGEHGIGIGKKKYLLEQFGESGCNLMRTIKKAIDPKNIMNPSKVV